MQILGIAERGHRDIHPRALRAERRQVGRHHHRGDVAGAHRGAGGNLDAHALEHRLQRLLGEGRVVQCVAGAGKADDEAIADQLVLPDAFDIGEILDSRCRVCRYQWQRHRKRERCGASHHPK